MRIVANGIEVDLPRGWDGRIFGRPRIASGPKPRAALPGFEPLAAGTVATLHAASFPLTGAEGAFGAEATLRMPERGAFLALVEYQVDEALTPGVGLFASRDVPRGLDPSEFRPETMMVQRGDQAGVQRFFTSGERPFCLYAVIGSRRDAAATVPAVNEALATLVIV